jgi:hypothetical protein
MGLNFGRKNMEVTNEALENDSLVAWKDLVFGLTAKWMRRWRMNEALKVLFYGFDYNGRYFFLRSKITS